MGEKQLFLWPTNVKELNKNQLTLLKLCVSSFLCGFLADLWPFNGCYWNRFALSVNLIMSPSLIYDRIITDSFQLSSSISGVFNKNRRCIRNQ